MANVPELTGLMSQPTVRNAGGLQYAKVTSDTTAQTLSANVGDKVTKVMGLAAKEAEDARKDMIKARATDLANQYYMYGKEITAGKGGAFHMKGADVVTPVDGQTFSQRYGGMLSDKRAELLSDISGDKELYDAVEAQIKTYERAFMSDIISYEGTESYNYVVSNAKVDLSNATESVRKWGPTEENLARVDESALRVARLNGLNVDDPAVRAAVIAGQRESKSAVVLESTLSALDRGDIGRAEALYITASNRQALTLDTRIKLKGLINGAKMERATDEAASNVATDIAMKRSPTYVAAEVAFGNALASEELIKESGNAGLIKASENPLLTASVNAGVMNYLADRYGDSDVALAAAVIGTDRMDEAIEAGGVTGWEDQLTPTEKASLTRARKKVEESVGLVTAPSESEIRAAIIRENPNMSSDWVDATTKKVADRIARETVRRDSEQLAAVQEAYNIIAQGGSMSQVKPSVKANLTNAQRQSLTVLSLRDPNATYEGNTEFYMRLSEDPDSLKAMTDADFYSVVRANTTDAQFASLAARRNRLKGMNDIDTDVTYSEVVRAVDMQGRLREEEWESTDNKARRQRIIDEAYRNALELKKHSVGTNAETNVIEWSVEKTFATRDWTLPGLVSSGGEKLSYDMKFGDYTSKNKDLGLYLARAKFSVREPSDHAKKEALFAATHDPDKMVSPTVMKHLRTVYENDVTEIEEAYKKAKGEKAVLSDAALVKLFILKNQQDPRYTAIMGGVAPAQSTVDAPKPLFNEDGSLVGGTD